MVDEPEVSLPTSFPNIFKGIDRYSRRHQFPILFQCEINTSTWPCGRATIDWSLLQAKTTLNPKGWQVGLETQTSLNNAHKHTLPNLMILYYQDLGSMGVIFKGFGGQRDVQIKDPWSRSPVRAGAKFSGDNEPESLWGLKLQIITIGAGNLWSITLPAINQPGLLPAR